MPILCDLLNKHGYWLRLSPDEYEVARMKLPAKHSLIYNGPCKSQGRNPASHSRRAVINLDSFYELENLEGIHEAGEVNIGLRVSFDIERGPPDLDQF